jgi:hypothetical protein
MESAAFTPPNAAIGGATSPTLKHDAKAAKRQEYEVGR